MKRLAFLAAAMMLAAAGQVEIRLQPGDTLSVQLARFPELSRSAMIADNGTFRIGGGAIPVAGLTLDEANEAIALRLNKELGVDPSSVLVDIAAYRPIVVQPVGQRGAEVAYRPAINVLQALAASRTVRSDAGSLLEELEGDRTQALVPARADRLARALALQARVTAERDRTDFVAPDLTGLGLTDARRAEIVSSEQTMLTLRADRFDEQIANLASQRAAVERQAGSLQEELSLQQERVRLASQLAERISDLDTRGLATQSRLTEVGTELVNAKLLVVRILADLADAETRLAQIDTAVNDLRGNWSLGIAELTAQTETEVASARRDLAEARRQAEIAGDWVGDGPATASAAGAVSESSEGLYRIHRIDADGIATSIEAGSLTRLLPGDVLEVRSQ